ncbi:hypothetical protein Tco_0537270, partial [Tanacetum coccineum]
QTTSSKEFSNPLIADSFLKTIWFSTHHASQDFKNHLSDNEESLGDDAPKQGRIDIGDIDTDAEITLIDETQGRINDIIADEDITLIPKLIIK